MANNSSHQPSHWSIRGVPADVRQIANDAAARAGVTIGEWLADAVRQAANSPATTTPTLLELARRVEVLEQQRSSALLALSGSSSKSKRYAVPHSPAGADAYPAARQPGIGGRREPTPQAVIDRIRAIQAEQVGIGSLNLQRLLESEGINVGRSAIQKHMHRTG